MLSLFLIHVWTQSQPCRRSMEEKDTEDTVKSLVKCHFWRFTKSLTPMMFCIILSWWFQRIRAYRMQSSKLIKMVSQILLCSLFFLGKWCNLTNIVFKRIESNHQLDYISSLFSKRWECLKIRTSAGCFSSLVIMVSMIQVFTGTYWYWVTLPRTMEVEKGPFPPPRRITMTHGCMCQDSWWIIFSQLSSLLGFRQIHSMWNFAPPFTRSHNSIVVCMVPKQNAVGTVWIFLLPNLAPTWRHVLTKGLRANYQISKEGNLRFLQEFSLGLPPTQ